VWVGLQRICGVWVSKTFCDRNGQRVQKW
jgi:hypothetical protein